MTETILTALADAFMQVGVYVAMLLAFFGWLQWRTGERVSTVLQRHRHWAPLIGALLGVSPGCAGALLVMPLVRPRGRPVRHRCRRARGDDG